MSQSTNPKASENIHKNWLIAAHLQSARSSRMSGDGGGGGRRVVMGATAAAGTARLGMVGVLDGPDVAGYGKRVGRVGVCVCEGRSGRAGWVR